MADMVSPSLTDTRTTTQTGDGVRQDTVPPREIVVQAVQAGAYKAKLSTGDMVIRGVLSGALLGAATLLALMAAAQGLPRLIGAMLFPVGFCMLVLLGLELATGNFALHPAAWYKGEIDGADLARNWIWVYLGNGWVAYFAPSSWPAR